MLHEKLARPDAPVDLNTAMEMLEAHPTFIIPALILLKYHDAELDDDTRHRLRMHVMLNCSDRDALTDYIDPAGGEWATFYPAPPEVVQSTEDTIDDFLNTYSAPSTPEEDRMIERLLFNPTPADYFAEADEPYDPSDPLALPPELMRDDIESPTAEDYDDVLPKTIPPASEDTTHHTQQTPKPTEDTLLTESLAKIYIKQQRYERAFEIISKLSLNYPEKSVYFADQLRFLQKLMINQQAKNHKS